MTVVADERTAAFDATLSVPSGQGPFPAFIHLYSGLPVLSASTFTDRGYALITLDTAVVAADARGRGGIFYELYPEADAGALMAWAWGVQRLVDALGTVDEIDATRLALNGFSRWGKAALVAGAFDERIALTVPSLSGLSGVGQYRFFYEDPSNPDTANERIDNAWSYAPWWYTARLGEFVDQVSRLPFDQHAVIALVAPRPFITTTGKYDYWTNPRGCSISWRAAAEVYDYLGATDRIGICWDDCAHELTQKHLDYMLDFADVHLTGASSTRDFRAMPTEFPDDPSTHRWSAPE